MSDVKNQINIKDELERLKKLYWEKTEEKEAVESLKGYGTSRFAKFLGFNDIGEIHKKVDFKLNLILYRHYKKTPKNKKIILINMPRGYGKTTLYNKLFILKSIIKNPMKSHLICSSKQKLAEDMLLPIKMLFENNVKIKKYYGEFKGKIWNAQTILVAQAQNNNLLSNSFTVETDGVDSNIASKHFDIIVVDDIIGKDNKDDPVFNEKALDFIKQRYILLNPGGIMLVLFMRWGERDFYFRLMEEFKGQYDLIRVTDVLRNENGVPITKTGIEIDENSPKRVPTFPEKYSLEYLDNERNILKDYIYSCHYAQFPKRTTYKLLDFNQLIKMSPNEHKVIVENIMLGNVPREQIKCVIDSSSTVSEQANYTGIAFWYYDKIDKKFFLFDFYKVKMLLHELADFIAPIIVKYNVPIVYYEKSGASGNLKYNLRKKLNELGRMDIILEPVFHKGENKKVRITSAQPFINTKSIYIPPEKYSITTVNGKEEDIMSYLKQEMDLFPQEGTNIPDDLIDACFGFLCDIYNIDAEYFNPFEHVNKNYNKITQNYKLDVLNKNISDISYNEDNLNDNIDDPVFEEKVVFI